MFCTTQLIPNIINLPNLSNENTAGDNNNTMPQASPDASQISTNPIEGQPIVRSRKRPNKDDGDDGSDNERRGDFKRSFSTIRV